MLINVKLFATLQDGRFAAKKMELPDGARVYFVITSLGIAEKEAAIIFINNKHAVPDTELKEGDTLAIFPPIGGG